MASFLEQGRPMSKGQGEQQNGFPAPGIEANADADQNTVRHGVSSGNSDSNNDNSANQYVMDMSRWEASTVDESGAPKRARKMTSTSDATSVTAASSFLDEGGVDDDGCAQGGEAGSLVRKPRLDSLDELPMNMEEDYECDGTNHSEKEEVDVDVEPDSCCYVWFKRIFLFLVIFASISFFVVLIGAAVEKKAFDGKEGTAHLYELPQVCGGHDEDLSFYGNVTQPQQQQLDSSAFTMLTTFDSAQEASDAGVNVAHCGSCGSCSTPHDLSIMAHTTESLTRDSTRCAFKIFLGRKAVEKCMEELVGFTPACEDCWLDNIGCSFKACKFTCIKYKLFRQDNNDGESDDLNDCLKCDERMCGEDFTVCSGSNRRRMGIISDIGRNADTEQCTAVDVDWASLSQGGLIPLVAGAAAPQTEDSLFD